MGVRLRAYAELAAAMAIAGSSVVAGKLVTVSFPVFLAAGLRFLVASAVLVPVLVARNRGFPRIGRKDLLTLFVQALAGVFLFSVFFLYGLRLTTAAASGIITSTTPALIGLMAFLFLRERLTWNRGAGIAVTVLGILVLNTAGAAPEGGRGADPLLGNLLVFGAALGEALFTILGKAVSARVTPLAITSFMSVFGLLLSLPAAVYEAAGFDFSGVPPATWAAMAYYCLVVTVVAFFLWYEGVSKVPASTAAVFTGVMPVSAVALSHLVLGEALLWSHLAGGACVLAGIGLIARDAADAPPPGGARLADRAANAMTREEETLSMRPARRQAD